VFTTLQFSVILDGTLVLHNSISLFGPKSVNKLIVGWTAGIRFPGGTGVLIYAVTSRPILDYTSSGKAAAA
jgi:hypothetical protein